MIIHFRFLFIYAHATPLSAALQFKLLKSIICVFTDPIKKSKPHLYDAEMRYHDSKSIRAARILQNNR